ncbi:hypothetical protein AX16_008009 [Volvariella volvacea WC 439]|nr:hypothetical protein AX16_008009 [Volvariella volvacea WC 439]
MSHRPEAWNAKARRSSGGTRKKGKLKLKRGNDVVTGDEIDTNAAIIVPKPKDEKEEERRKRLKEELLAQQANSKWTSRKNKRLEKYIDKKLKKEERVELLEKLARSQADIPTTLHLQSSATLGTGRAATHQELQDREEDLQVRRALDGVSRRRKRHRDNFAVVEVDDDDDFLDADNSDEEMRQKAITKTKAGGPPVSDSNAAGEPTATSSRSASPSEVGSALKRNSDGTVIAPKIRPKREKKSALASWKVHSKRAQSVQEDSDSFDSSDSAYDPSDGESIKRASGEDNAAASVDKGESGSDEGSSVNEEDTDNDGKSESDEDEAMDVEEPSPKPKKSLGFKDWALKQLSASRAYIASPEDLQKSNSVIEETASEPSKKKRKVDLSQSNKMRGPMGEDLTLPSTAFTEHLLKRGSDEKTAALGTRAKAVSVTRPPDVEEARLMLPIVTEEQPIMEAILLNPVVIICGETGSGKTTQVPQFLYEAGFGSPGSDNPGMIGITQPRRVAAMSMAARVAHELSLTSSRVSYQIRYDATVAPTTSIKFMTDGVLLRELATDFLLTKYSIIIIDEAHERSMNTDILIGVLSRVLTLREDMWKQGKDNIKPLRLIIMSATLRVADFAENKTLFPAPPPVISIGTRQHPVTVHFSRRTSNDYINEAIKKTVKIHNRLPPGGILIFLTGQNEILGVCRKLETRFGMKALEERRKRANALSERIKNAAHGLNDIKEQTIAPAQVDVEAEDIDFGQPRADELALDVDDNMDQEEDPEALDTDDEDSEDDVIIENDGTMPMHILPLYSLLPSEKQMKVFQSPPPGHRLVVVATNVAETSLTIPGIRYVVDTGRAKERRYDITNGIQAFQVSWISKASAAQRAGRAGRTGPGHCYRLYSSALFENYFDQFAKPEILRMPIEGVVLQMKSMHIDAVINFPFPTPPDRQTLHKAEKTLTHLGALKSGSIADKSAAAASRITELGKTMSLFPLSPRYSRMLVTGQQHGCLPYIVAIVSVLSVGDPFLHEEVFTNAERESEGEGDNEGDLDLVVDTASAKETRRLRRKAYFKSHSMHSALGKSTSDMLKMLSVVGAYEYAGGGPKFCEEHFVRPKAMEEIHKLRAQISNIVQMNFPEIDAGFNPKLKPPNELQIKVLKQLLTAGFIDQVAVRKDRVDKSFTSGSQYATSKGVPYRALSIDEDVYIHPSSVLANNPPPEYVIFHEVVRTSKVWIKGLTVVNPAWLSSLGKGTLCTFSKPMKNNAGNMMVIPHFGSAGWELPAIKAELVQ